MTLSRRAIVIVLVALWTLGTLRAAALFLHDPLYAYANSYDETRYTTCFHFYPDRPADITPEAHSPEAPFANFRFIQTGDPMCYWSTELVFGGAAALGWSASEAFGGSPVHDVRSVAALRWLALLSISIALSVAWLRRGDTRAAIANAALVPLVFADPGNTLYLATFYAEWTALLAAYALIVVPTKTFSAWAGGLALGFIMIPLVLRTTEEVLVLVPNAYREAALALGLPRWKIIVHIVLRTALKGIVTGVLLALGRVAGETAPLLFTAFGNRFWSHQLSEPIAALPLQIFTYAISPYEDWHRQAWAGALVLVLLVFVLSAGVRLFFADWKKRP